MAEAPLRFSQNAQNAAAAAKTCATGGCESCVKQGLPVLLVRPGLADKAYAQQRADLIQPLLRNTATPSLTSAGYVMRTLRKGYLYAYYDQPPTPQIKAQGGWQAFTVDDGGYLTPITLAQAAAQDGEAFACERSSSYATAMLFVIPNHRQVERVWVGFSAYPWSEAVRSKYAGSAELRGKRMSCIEARSSRCSQSIPLTPENLSRGVADFDAGMPASALRGNPFPRRIPASPGQTNGANAQGSPLAQDQRARSRVFLEPPLQVRPDDARMVWEQAQTLAQAAQPAPLKPANLMIVSVLDAEAVTAEAAQRRTTLCNSAAEWLVAQADGSWKLTAALQIKGLLKLVEQHGANHRTRNASFADMHRKEITRDEFNQFQKDGRLPPDARAYSKLMNADSPTSARIPVYSPNIVVVDIPGEREIDAQTRRMYDNILDKLQAGRGGASAHRAFLDQYKQHVEDDRKRLEQLELDHKAWLQSAERKLLTEHDFDEYTQEDGEKYAECVCNLTQGGPITDRALQWYKPFLGEDPNDKEALLTRALLGNQADFFGWLTDQKATGYDMAKTLLDLEPVKSKLQTAAASARQGAQMALQVGALGTAQALLTTSGAVLSLLQKAGELSENLAYQCKLLAMALMHKSEATPIQLVRVQVSLQEANRLWQVMLGHGRAAARSAMHNGQWIVESLVLDAGVAVSLSGSPKAGMGVVDVYLIASGQEISNDTSRALGHAAKRYALQPAMAQAAEAAQTLAHSVTMSTLLAHARHTAAVLRSGSGVLTAGSGLLQILLLGSAWEKYQKAVGEDRQAAAVSILTAGLGVSAAMLELGGIYAEKSGRKAAEVGLKRAAGVLGAGATVIDGVQALVNGWKAIGDGDGAAGYGQFLQGFFFVGAAIFLGSGTWIGATAATGSAAAATATALTGWGLILLALGLLVGLVVLYIRDTPPEKWAAKTIWGNANDKWGTLEKEIQELNKIVLGAAIHFSYSQEVMANVGRSMSMAHGAGIAALFSGREPEPMLTAQAMLQLKLPRKLGERLPWELRIYGKTQGRGEALVAGAVSVGGKVSYLRTPGRAGDSADMNFQFKSTEEGDEATLSLRLDMARYRDAWAQVSVYASEEGIQAEADGLQGDEGQLIVRERLEG